LNRKDDGTAVRLGNPKTVEYEVVRTSLLPGLLKTIRENKSIRLPIMISEVADVAFKDDSLERRVSRCAVPLFLGQSADPNRHGTSATGVRPTAARLPVSKSSTAS